MLKKYWWVILIGVLVVITIPLVIDRLIIGNSFPSNISNSDWVGFLGGYIGAVMGGLVSLIGIGVTIRFTKQQIELNRYQFSEQNRLNNQPLLDFEITNVFEKHDEETIILNCEYTLKNKELFQKAIVEFNIYNIGLGAAIDIKYGMEIDGELQDGVFWCWKNRSLKSGCNTKQKLMILFPTKEAFSPNIMVFYDDVLGNHYVKRVKLLNQQTEKGQQMICILTQEKGDICDVKIGKEYYVISAMQQTDTTLGKQ